MVELDTSMRKTTSASPSHPEDGGRRGLGDEGGGGGGVTTGVRG